MWKHVKTCRSGPQIKRKSEQSRTSAQQALENQRDSGATAIGQRATAPKTNAGNAEPPGWPTPLASASPKCLQCPVTSTDSSNTFGVFNRVDSIANELERAECRLEDVANCVGRFGQGAEYVPFEFLWLAEKRRIELQNAVGTTRRCFLAHVSSEQRRLTRLATDPSQPACEHENERHATRVYRILQHPTEQQQQCPRREH